MKRFLLIAVLLCTTVNLVMAQHTHHEGCIHSKGYAAHSSEGVLVPFEFDRKPVGDNDVLIEILYSGICHSDIHEVRNEWGPTTYPIVPGHEIIGKFIQIGKDVTKFKVGDYAGVGCMVNSCRVCDKCKAGLEQYCENNKTVFTYNSKDFDGDNTYGGYSNNIVITQHFGIKVPEGAPLDKIAPLLCAGITTYSPLRAVNVKQGDKVAIAGFGGLGHLAVQYAVSFSAEVTVFDISEEKRELAKQLGAVKFVNVNNPAETEGMINYFDVVLSTIPANYNIEQYMGMVKIGGDMAIVGVPAATVAPSVNLNEMPWGKKVWRSLIGGIPETQEMLDYSVANNIYPMVEMIPIQQVNEAYSNVIDGNVHFRYVMDMKTLK